MMRPIAVALIAFALGAGVGGVVGGLFAPEDGARERFTLDSGGSRHAESSAASERPAIDVAVPDAGIAAAGEPRGGTEAALEEPIVAPSALRSLAAAEAIEIPTGDGVIDGAVRDESGNPLVGAVVRAQRIDSREPDLTASHRGRGPPPETGLDETVKKAVADYQRAAAARLETRTDAAGEYRFERLADAPYHIRAYADGYVVEPRGNARSVSPNQRIEFLAKGVTRVPVRVVLPDGRNAKKARLAVRAGDDESAELWSADQSTLLLAPGRYKLRAAVNPPLIAANGLSDEVVSEEVEVDVAGGTEAPEVTLLLKGRLGIRGTVRFGSDIVIEQGIIKYAPLTAGQVPDLAMLSQIESNHWVHWSRPKFEILDLKPGRYVVGLANGWNGTIVTHEIVEIEDRVVEVVFDTSSIDVTGAITITVLGPDGVGLEGVDFNFVASTPNRSNSNVIQPLSRGKGVYLLDIDFVKLRADLGASEGEVKVILTARTEAFGEASTEVRQGIRELTMRLEAPAFADVTIVGYRGSELEGKLALELHPVNDGGIRYWSGDSPVESDGTKRIGPKAPGEYNLSLTLATGQRWNRTAIAIQKVALRSGENRLAIAIPNLSRLVVDLPAGVEGQVMLFGNGAPTRRVTIENGQAAFENLPPGQFTLRYQGGAGNAEATVNVPERTRIALTPEKPKPEAETKSG
jgi:hypothetical protein